MPWSRHPDPAGPGVEPGAVAPRSGRGGPDLAAEILDPVLAPLGFAPGQVGVDGERGQVIFCRGEVASADGGCVDLVVDVEATPDWRITDVRYWGFSSDRWHLDFDRDAHLAEQLAYLAQRLLGELGIGGNDRGRAEELEFQALLAEAEATPFEEWDFSHLAGRMVEGEPPWAYGELVLARMAVTETVLDLGTGGGELLAGLLAAADRRPARVVATEAWPPNVEVARRRLEPMDVEVVAVDPAPDNVDIVRGSGVGSLPFPDRSFSLVINRHESYFPAEVARILAPGGTFLTQQVGGRYLDGLSGLFGIPEESVTGWDLGFAVAQLEEAGLAVMRQEESFPDVAFHDVGALAYYLKAVPWQLPGFTVEAHRSALRSVHDRIRSTGPLRLRGHYFLVEATTGATPSG